MLLKWFSKSNIWAAGFWEIHEYSGAHLTSRRSCSNRCLPMPSINAEAWWRHQLDIFIALLALCAANSPVTGEFPPQRPVTQNFVFFDLDPWIKQSRGWWLEAPSRSLWCHCRGMSSHLPYKHRLHRHFLVLVRAIRVANVLDSHFIRIFSASYHLKTKIFFPVFPKHLPISWLLKFDESHWGQPWGE